MKYAVKNKKADRQKIVEKLGTAMILALAVVIAGFLLGCAEKINYHLEYVPLPQFLLGPEDVLMVDVWRNEDLSGEAVIRPDGMISLPLVGDVPAAGLTAPLLAKNITDRLTEFMESPTVSVQVLEVNSYYVHVLGEVNTPGKVPLKSFTTVLQAISMVGGLTEFASANNIHVLRMRSNGAEEHQEVRIPVRYKDMISGKAEIGNFILNARDIIVVP